MDSSDVSNEAAGESTPSLVIIQPGNKINTVRLTNDNYLLWKFQIEFAIEGHGLQKAHVLSDSGAPPEFIQVSDSSSSSATRRSNPQLEHWKKQDKLLCSWLLGSMSEDILEQMLHCTMAKEIWTTLSQIFNSRNLAQVMKIKSTLKNIKKGGSPLSEYFSKIKKCIDALTAIGKSVPIEDHIMYILNGLGAEYESMISVITAKICSEDVHEVMALLLTHESRIEAKAVNVDGTLPSANVATQSSTPKEVDTQRSNNQQFNSNRGRGGGGRGGRGGRGQWNNRNKVQCQHCHKFGHTSQRCYYRNDPPTQAQFRSPSPFHLEIFQ